VLRQPWRDARVELQHHLGVRAPVGEEELLQLGRSDRPYDRPYAGTRAQTSSHASTKPCPPGTPSHLVRDPYGTKAVPYGAVAMVI